MSFSLNEYGILFILAILSNYLELRFSSQNKVNVPWSEWNKWRFLELVGFGFIISIMSLLVLVLIASCAPPDWRPVGPQRYLVLIVAMITPQLGFALLDFAVALVLEKLGITIRWQDQTQHQFRGFKIKLLTSFNQHLVDIATNRMIDLIDKYGEGKVNFAFNSYGGFIVDRTNDFSIYKIKSPQTKLLYLMQNYNFERIENLIAGMPETIELSDGQMWNGTERRVRQERRYEYRRKTDRQLI